MSHPDNSMAGTAAAEDVSVSKKRSHPDDFKRAYKACINCRQRKAKCILDPGPAGELKPPCQRCKREMRECVFRSERSWVKRRKPGEARAEETAVEESSVPNPARPVMHQSPNNPPTVSIPGNIGTPIESPHRRRSESILSPATLRRVSSSKPDLAHSVMRTVVSSGSDALNLLFEAANHRDALENQEQGASQHYDTPQSGPSYPQPGTSPPKHRMISRNIYADSQSLQGMMVEQHPRSSSRHSPSRCHSLLQRRLGSGPLAVLYKWGGSLPTRP